MANPLMTIVQNAIGEGKLRPENYRDAINVSRDPEVTEYLEGLLTQEAVPVITDKVLNEETLELMDRPAQGNANPRSVRPVTTTDQPTSKGSNPRAASLNKDVVEEAESPANKVSSRKYRRDTLAEEAIESKAAEEAGVKAAQEATEAEFGRTLTLDDISNSFRLQQLGALSGDRVKDNELVREFSSDNDAIDIDRVITQENIDGSDNLQKLEAVAGDLIIRNKEGELEFLSRGAEAQTRQFMYEYIKNPNYLSNGKMFLEALFPIPSGAKAYTTSYGYSPYRKALCLKAALLRKTLVKTLATVLDCNN